MANRKRHNGEAGYIAERRNPMRPGQKVVIYVASEQGIDVEDKYAVVCVAHGTFGSAASVPKARVLMKSPSEFCGRCRELIDYLKPRRATD